MVVCTPRLALSLDRCPRLPIDVGHGYLDRRAPGLTFPSVNRFDGPSGENRRLDSRHPARLWLAGGGGALRPFLAGLDGSTPTGKLRDLVLDFDPGSNVVEVYVRYLRAKIGADRIETVRGMGYRLK